MKIRIINPDYGVGEEAMAQVCGFLQHYVGPDVELSMGCLSFLGLAEPLSRELGIPVIDPAIGAVSLAESLVRQGLATSKVAYPKPLSTAF